MTAECRSGFSLTLFIRSVHSDVRLKARPTFTATWAGPLSVAMMENIGMPSSKIAARIADPLAERESLPPDHEPDGMRPIRFREFWNGHWIGFVFLLPFVLMWVVHVLLGMSDAFLVADNRWDRVSADYNLAMFLALFLGSLVFVIYAFALPIVKGRGWKWVLPKIIFLVVYWGVVMLAVTLTSVLHP
jgi:hypothetical protein